MNVGELIDQLQQLPKETMVVRSGYEGGVNEVKEVRECTIALNVNTDWYYGKHEEIDSDYPDDYEKHERAKAIYIR